MNDIMLVLSISGDCACLYNTIAVFLYEDEYICTHWWYWKKYITLPFKEVVGVGKAREDVSFEKEDQLLDFLQTDRSLLMWSGHTDIAVLANMCNLNIYTFTYYNNKPPMWSNTAPDPHLTLCSIPPLSGMLLSTTVLIPACHP